MNGGKTSFSAASAAERLWPASTSWRTLTSTRRSSGFSTCSPRIVSARSSDRPASTIVASCRAAIARSFVVTFLRPKEISFCSPVPVRRTSRGT